MVFLVVLKDSEEILQKYSHPMSSVGPSGNEMHGGYYVISLMLVSSDDVWMRSHDNNQDLAKSSYHHVCSQR